MHSFILYNYTMSVCSMKTRLAMAEFGLEFEDRQVDIGFALENFEPDYVRLNRRAVVPTLIVDGEVTTNSVEIVMRLARLSGRGFPEDDTARETAITWFKRGDDINFQVITYGRKGVPRGDELLVDNARGRRSTQIAFPRCGKSTLRRFNGSWTMPPVRSIRRGSPKPKRTCATRLIGSWKPGSLLPATPIRSPTSCGRSSSRAWRWLGLASEILGRAQLLAYYEAVKLRPSLETARVMPQREGRHLTVQERLVAGRADTSICPQPTPPHPGTS